MLNLRFTKPHIVIVRIILALLLGISAVLLLQRDYYFLFIPIIALIAFFLFQNLEWTYILMIAVIPISTELSFGAVKLDCPDEIFNIFFLCLLPGWLLYNYKDIDLGFLRHPISIFLMMMLAITIFSTFFSTNLLVSLKYLLAKIWYLVAYFFFSAYFLKDNETIRKTSLFFILSAFFTVIIVLIRHASKDFLFEEVNFVLAPFYSNHVNYALQLLVIFPFIWMYWKQNKIYKKSSFWVICVMLIFVVAIYFSFTRAAIGALLLLVPFYFIIKWRIFKPVFFITIILLTGLLFHLIKDNKFFQYAPDFNKTVSYNQFNKLLTATYNLEDASTMERVYRWVAARYMILDKPLLGVGPNTFYENYKPYTIKSFRTWVSQNPEKSSVHCYILLLAIEQGLIASLLFVILLFYAFSIGQKIYHEEKDPINQSVIMASLMTLFAMVIVLTINDVIESDKEGSFFYISLAIIARMHYSKIKKSQDNASLFH